MTIKTTSMLAPTTSVLAATTSVLSATTPVLAATTPVLAAKTPVLAAKTPVLAAKTPVLAATTITQKLESKTEESKKKCSEPITKTESFYRCKNCKNMILGPNAENLYVEHILTCLDANNFECSICFKKFAHKRGLTNHLRLTHLVFD